MRHTSLMVVVLLTTSAFILPLMIQPVHATINTGITLFTYSGNGSVAVGGNKITITIDLSTITIITSQDTASTKSDGFSIVIDWADSVAVLSSAFSSVQTTLTNPASGAASGITFSNAFPSSTIIDVAPISSLLNGGGNLNTNTYDLIVDSVPPDNDGGTSGFVQATCDPSFGYVCVPPITTSTANILGQNTGGNNITQIAKSNPILAVVIVVIIIVIASALVLRATRAQKGFREPNNNRVQFRR